MIYIIDKMLVLIKTSPNYLKNNIFGYFFEKFNRLLSFTKVFFFSEYIMLEHLRSKEENIIKDIKNLFRLKTKLNYTAIKDIRNLFRLKKETKAIKDRILRDIKNLVEHEEEEKVNYNEQIRASNFLSNNYIEYESNGDRNKILSVEEYRNKTKIYLKRQHKSS